MNELLVTFIAVTLLILLLASGIFLTLIISSKQRLRHEMMLADARIAYERELRVVETEVTESVLGRFSRELHDNLGQLLAALEVHIENYKLDFPQMADKLRPAEIYIAEISQQLRLLSRTINKDYVGHAGLFRSITIEVERLKALKRFTVHFTEPEGKSNLDADQELMVLRMFQEITQNVIRHANAANLFVSIGNSGEAFSLSVRDDGKGFDKDAALAGLKGSGLRNIQHRARLAGLECLIESTPGEGSLFILRKPANLDGKSDDTR